MATMASLLVEVGADIGKFVGGMTKMEAVARTNARAIRREFEQLAGQIGATLSAGAFAYAVKGTIDTMDRLDELSKATNVAVEDLAGLSIAAKTAGGDLEGVAASVNKLAQNMGKDAEKFKQLGITAKDPLEAFKQLSDIFSKIEDPQLRAAFAAEALGKSWQSAAPLMAEGGERIGELVEKGKQYSGITAEMTAQANEFNDKMVLLVGTGGLTNKMVGDLLPLLNLVADGLLKSADNARGMAGDFKPLLETGKALAVVFGNIAFVLKAIGTEIGGVAAQMVAFFRGDWKRAAEIGRMMKADAEANRLAFDKWEAGIMAIGTAAAAAAPPVKAMGKTGVAAAEAAAKAFISTGDAAKKATKALKEYGDARAHVDAMIAHSIKMAELSNKAFDEALDLDEKRLQATNDIIKGVRLDAEAMEFELRTMGMSNAERARFIALLKLQASGADVSAESMQRLADRIYNSVQAMEDMRAQASVWNELGDVAGRFFSDLVMNGKSAFDNLKKWAKQLLADMIALFAKRWVLQMAAGLTGNASLASQAGQLGQGTITGAMGNALSSWFGSTAAGAAFTGLGEGFALGFSGSMAGPLASYGTAAGSFGAQLGALAANPVTWIVAAAVAAVLIINSRRGGPKEGGSFFGTYDAAGNFMSTAAVPGTDNGRFFTPSSQDSAMRTLTDSFARGFHDTLTRLGGTTGAMQFGFGTDQDPQGSAANRVMGAIYQNGMQVFRSMMDAGRDDADLQRAFGLTMKRMLLAGLQNSNLPHGLARILNTVSAATGTEEEITKIIEVATAFGDLMTVVTAPFTSGGIIEAASKDATTLLKEQGAALVKLADNTEMTTEDLQALTQSTAAFRQAAAQLILTLEALKRTAASTIDGMIQQTVLAGMNPQQQFDYWQTEAQRLWDEMMASTDPAEIERLFGQWTTAWSNAWSLLSPEQQASDGAEWGRRLVIARGLITAHIDSLITGVVTDTNTVLRTVGDKMDAAADKFGTAADKNTASTEKFAGTVDRGIKVHLIVDQYGNLIVNESGSGA